MLRGPQVASVQMRKVMERVITPEFKLQVCDELRAGKRLDATPVRRALGNEILGERLTSHGCNPTSHSKFSRLHF